MSRAMKSRLRKLETATTSSQRRMFVFESEAKRRELIASSIAQEDDLFIYTGVVRGAHSYAGRGGS